MAARPPTSGELFAGEREAAVSFLDELEAKQRAWVDLPRHDTATAGRVEAEHYRANGLIVRPVASLG